MKSHNFFLISDKTTCTEIAQNETWMVEQVKKNLQEVVESHDPLFNVVEKHNKITTEWDLNGRMRKDLQEVVEDYDHYVCFV